MTKEAFENSLQRQTDVVEQIRRAAYLLHDSVNQTYGDGLPYGYHLDMVASGVREFGHLVCVTDDDVLPLMFSAYFHDSIEDARLTYNDVMDRARQLMTEEQAFTASEIVYALTNDKGRTRAERAGERYYSGIRETPYAPFVKLCDRMANIIYSCSVDSAVNSHMMQVYKEELRHFLEAIDPHSDDPRFGVPEVVVQRIASSFNDSGQW